MNEPRHKILSVGEILWDLLPEGRKVGGAPANFAYHCRQQGGDVRLLSRIGDDPLGRDILDYCTELGLSTEMIEVDPESPTGTVQVTLGADGQPSYTIVENVAWDFLEAIPAATRWASTTDAICFGSLALRGKRNRETLQTLLGALRDETLRVLDLNLRPPFCEGEIVRFALSSANVLKINDDELEHLARLLPLKRAAMPDQLRELRDMFRFRLVILTCGAEGSLLTDEREQVHVPGRRVAVADTVGAGDAYTAATVMGFLQNRPLEEIGHHANELAAYVCTQRGGTSPIPPELAWND